MFWGLVMKADKRYTQTVSKSFHISHATLDLHSCNLDEDDIVQVWVTSEQEHHLLCNLGRKSSQAALDLAFSEGESIVLYSKGSGSVHLTGFLLPEEPDFEGMGGFGEEEESVDDEEEESHAQKNNRLKKMAKKIAGNEDDDDSDDSDFDENTLERALQGSDDEVSEEEALSEEEEEEDSDSDDEPQPKHVKLDKGVKPKQNGVPNGKGPKEQPQPQKKGGKAQPTTTSPAKEEAQKPKTKTRTLAGGVIVEDLRVGKGPEAKKDKKVSVYYEGRLKANNKLFDSTKSGDGFKFNLGRGEVIRGWDVGVLGMKVGSKRRITCPASAAYGAKGSPPVIPPNATLVFDVELRGVN